MVALGTRVSPLPQKHCESNFDTTKTLLGSVMKNDTRRAVICANCTDHKFKCFYKS
jgi:hypothetical protein